VPVEDMLYRSSVGLVVGFCNGDLVGVVVGVMVG